CWVSRRRSDCWPSRQSAEATGISTISKRRRSEVSRFQGSRSRRERRRNPEYFRARNCAFPFRKRSSAILWVGQFASCCNWHLCRSAGGRDESELCRGQPRGGLRRTRGHQLVQADGSLPL